MADPTTTVRVPKRLVEDLKLIAEKHHRSVNGEASYALERYVEEHRQILDAAREQAAT